MWRSILWALCGPAVARPFNVLIHDHYVGLRQQRPPDDVMLGFPAAG